MSRFSGFEKLVNALKCSGKPLNTVENAIEAPPELNRGNLCFEKYHITCLC